MCVTTTAGPGQGWYPGPMLHRREVSNSGYTQTMAQPDLIPVPRYRRWRAANCHWCGEGIIQVYAYNEWLSEPAHFCDLSRLATWSVSYW